MVKAFALIHKFGLFAPKTAEPAEKDDMFVLRLKRLHPRQSVKCAGLLFRTQPAHREA